MSENHLYIKKNVEAVENETFSGATAGDLMAEAYENCTFLSCNFQEADLGGLRFVDCVFEDSNLSMAKMIETAFREVRFVRCKLFSLFFDQCNGIGFKAEFEQCALDGTSFVGMKLGNQRFKDCILYGVDFTGTFLSGAQFINCDLMDARFDNSCLEKADFRSARDFELDPEANVMTGARFSRANLSGLLRKYRLKLE